MVTTDAATAIPALLYRYAELVDSGRFEDLAGDLFARCRFVVAPPPAETIDGPAMAALLVSTTIRYEDGTPRTRHVITNPQIDVDPDGAGAVCRSAYTVFQEVKGELKPVVSGRYRDRFAADQNGAWFFAERDYTMMDLIGDVSHHLRFDPRPRGSIPLAASDLAELRHLVDRYADAVDRRDTTALNELFRHGGSLLVQPDDGPVEAEWTAPELDGITDVIGHFHRTFHHIGGAAFEPGERPGRASGRVHCLAHHYDRTDNGPVDLVMMIIYHDDYERGSGGWRIARRRVAIQWRELHPAHPIRRRRP